MIISALAKGFKTSFSGVIFEPLSYANAHTDLQRKALRVARPFVGISTTMLSALLLIALINYEFFILIISAIFLTMNSENAIVMYLQK